MAIVSRREQIAFSEALGSVVLERILDTCALAAFGLGAAVIVGVSGDIIAIGLAGLLLGVGAAAALIAGSWVFERISLPVFVRVRGVVAGVMRGATMHDRPRAVAMALALSGFAWVLDAIIFSVMARAIGIDLSPDRAMVVATVAALSTAIPSAPGFVGTFELATAFAARAVGVDPTAALGLAVTVHAVALISVAAAGLVAAVSIGGVRGVIKSAVPPLGDRGSAAPIP